MRTIFGSMLISVLALSAASAARGDEVRPFTTWISLEARRVETAFAGPVYGTAETYELYGAVLGAQVNLPLGGFILSPGLSLGLLGGPYDYRLSGGESGSASADAAILGLFLRGAYPFTSKTALVGGLGLEYLSLHTEARNNAPYPYREGFDLRAGDVYAEAGVSRRLGERLSLAALFRAGIAEIAVSTNYRLSGVKPDVVSYSHRAVRLAVTYDF